MIKNANNPPTVFYGLHFVEGVAEYREPGKEPYRILIREDAIKNMDPSFAGRPVYVDHVDQVNLDRIQEEADGYVSESFFNKSDGRHWVKFIAISDRAHEAIRSGWRLSNAYQPTEMAPGGLWHGVEYAKEVIKGVHDHMAIVQSPRYEESIILTPEEFKSYNEKKEQELVKLSNEGDRKMAPKLNFWKRSKVENSADFETTVVTLPESGKELSIADLVKNADIEELKKKEPKMANGDEMVKVGDDSMSVNDLVSKHLEMCANMKKNDDENLKEEADKQKKNEDDDMMENKEDEEEKKKKENEKAGAAELEKEEKKQNAADEKAKKQKNFESLKNAHHTVQNTQKVVEISMDQLARGKSRYGSAS